ncbi:GAK system CofD-like protein [Maribrevibacterium harenarium]|uniref:GAK system CofD-like protein n=1 Tax=Maribrevibacterium harenarium TaxID=2589817 RepID=A0A501WN82_9GAMM|nr:GAK system CofD-like protein [Maribrevibacterium harenarium]TPE49800.1 GAK system CofD-like protein [Maribrevibacterium harenarium]
MQVSRALCIPDPVRLQRYRHLPELGPSILFFSGGSALNKLSRELKRYTHNSIHLVTPFDSGGSSAHLRRAFAMPAVGDLRSRIMALADETVLGQPDVYHLFSHRLAKHQSQTALKAELERLVNGEHTLIKPVSNPLKSLIQTQLRVVQQRLPEEFDLRGASVGNLIIAGGYLNNEWQLDPIVFLFSRLVKTLGQVVTIVDADAHLGVRLQDGTMVLGQHLLTGKEVAPLASPITSIWLNDGEQSHKEVSLSLSEDRGALIREADIICYPPGSFFSSICANLLVAGVSEAIGQNPNPKIYLPNLGTDPEQLGWSLMDRIVFLIRLVSGREPEFNVTHPVLTWLLLDCDYDYGEVNEVSLDKLGITVVRAPLKRNEHQYDEVLVAEALLSFA